VKRTLFFATLLLSAVALLTTSCGTSDSIKSLLLTSNGTNNTGTYNLPGVDATLQLKVFAVYNSGKQIDVTNKVTWSVTPICCDQDGNNLPPYGPASIPINATGMVTGIAQICTWTDALDNSKNPPVYANPPIWEYTGYYQTTASYRGFTSQPVGIGVGVVASKTSPVGGCGPA